MRTSLPQVTLCAATSVALDATVRALETSMEQVQFARVVLFSDRRPRDLHAAIEWSRISPLRTKEDYSRFMLHELGNHISTSHALCVQWDGFVLRGDAWDPDFLCCDYIGAPWPHFVTNRVGNGGFSLRSRRLLNATSKLPCENGLPEDIVLARVFRERLESDGIHFACEDLARKFAYERMPATGREFGFHGAFNLVKHVMPREGLETIRGLEPELLTRSEHRELFKWAAANVRPRLAAAVFWRMVKAPPRQAKSG